MQKGPVKTPGLEGASFQNLETGFWDLGTLPSLLRCTR